MLVAAIQTPVQAGEDEKTPLVLEPSSQWNIDYGDDSCRLTRLFGKGENETAFFIERYAPGDWFFLVVAGGPLDAPHATTLALHNVPQGGDDPVLRFGPNGYEYDGSSEYGEFGKYSPAIMLGMRFIASPDDPKSEADYHFDPEEEARDTNVLGQKTTAAQEDRISWFEVRQGAERPVRLALGSMGPPMAAMRKCTDELVTHWGIDVEAHRGLTRAAAPKSDPGTWVRTSDYPYDLMRDGKQGKVHFRLNVSAEGAPTRCHIQQWTQPSAFDDAVCAALMRRARFEPARDANGRPIASFWGSTVVFLP